MLNSPISPEKLDRIIGQFSLSPDSRVLDLGCGDGDFLRRIFSQTRAECHGVDPDTSALQSCRKREPDTRLILHETTGAEFVWPVLPFDLIICTGSSHAFGGFIPTLRVLRKHIPAGGLIFMGEVYWRKTLDPAYMEFLGEGWPDFDLTFADLLRAGEEEGLIALYNIRSSQEEWDHFEGAFAQRKIQAALNLTDPDARAKAFARQKAWRDAYLRWGRSSMGFGLYLFSKPAPG